MSFLFRSASPRQLDVALTVLRVIVGAVFIAHGGQKLFVWGLDGVAQGFGGMGIPFAGVTGPFVAFVEFLGGIALVAGLLTRLAALGLAGTMVGAILFVHLSAGFFLPNGSEFALVLLTSSVVLMVTGAGGWSLDALIAKRGGSSEAIAAEARPLAPRRAA